MEVVFQAPVSLTRADMYNLFFCWPFNVQMHDNSQVEKNKDTFLTTWVLNNRKHKAKKNSVKPQTQNNVKRRQTTWTEQNQGFKCKGA